MSHGRMHDLTVSLEALRDARSDVEAKRSQGSARGSSTWLYEGLLAALEDYAATLTKYGYPIPPRMHTDLAMYRALAGAPWRQAPQR